jgi:hypothetical protein
VVGCIVQFTGMVSTFVVVFVGISSARVLGVLVVLEDFWPGTLFCLTMLGITVTSVQAIHRNKQFLVRMLLVLWRIDVCHVTCTCFFQAFLSWCLALASEGAAVYCFCKSMLPQGETVYKGMLGMHAIVVLLSVWFGISWHRAVRKVVVLMSGNSRFINDLVVYTGS